MSHKLSLALVIALTGAAFAAAVATVATPFVAVAHAADETAAERVARLLPDLGSENAEVRARAERELFSLGPAGQAEMERIARGDDLGQARIALKLLSSRRWDDAARTAKTPPSSDDGSSPARTIDELVRSLREKADAQIREVERRYNDLKASLPSDANTQTSESGTVVENGSSLSWEIDVSGKVKVTTKEQGAAEAVVTAESMETLRAEHADLAKRVDDRRAGMRVRTWKWPEMPDMPKFPDLPKLDEMPETMRRLYRDTDGRLRLREPFAQESDTPVPAASPTDAEALPSPRLGVTIEPLSDVLRDQLDLPEGGIVVREVLPRTLAERLGLRRNDVLLSVAGRSVSVAADVIGALAPVKEGEKLAVEIVRKSRRETLSVVR